MSPSPRALGGKLLPMSVSGSRLGRLVRELREGRNLTQAELAAEAGLPTRTVGRVERGEVKNPNPDTLMKLALGLEVEVELLSSCRTGRRSEAPPPARASVGEYVARFLASLGDVGEFDPSAHTTGHNENEKVSSALDRALSRARVVELVGASGTGKSWACRALARRRLETGWLVVEAQARYFDGDFRAWLDESVASRSEQTFADLAARAAQVLLIVDGLNECREGITERLALCANVT